MSWNKLVGPLATADEDDRLKDLLSYQILDTLPEEDYDNLTALAAEICGTPVSLVTMVDQKRQWFKSHHGIDVEETPREFSFCAHSILQPDQVMIVEDTRKDDRFRENPLVTHEPNVVFYAGVPVRSTQGFPLGTLCVVDFEPQRLSDSQVNALRILSLQVANLLKLRKANLQLRQANLSLEARSKEIEQFNYITSHDLQEPLRTISNYSSYLTRSYTHKLDDRGLKSLEFISGAAKRMSVLIRGILDYSRIGQQKEWTQVDCQDVLTNVVADLALRIEETQARVDIGDMPRIKAHEPEIRALFQNLISNAIKFVPTERSPRIHVSAQQKEQNWIFAIADNGIGIEEAYRERIFTIFQRLHTQREYEGTGIGLSHCRKIVKAHQGDIWFESEPNEGTTFYFSIPTAL
ncbi:MAG: ATP-binding protein [Bacteroidota bacterium]